MAKYLVRRGFQQLLELLIQRQISTQVLENDRGVLGFRFKKASIFVPLKKAGFLSNEYCNMGFSPSLM